MQLRNAGDGPNAGYFYVCGSASTLAKDVTNVLGDLLSILTLSGSWPLLGGCWSVPRSVWQGENGDAVKGFTRLNELQDSGRVIFDVWG